MSDCISYIAWYLAQEASAVPLEITSTGHLSLEETSTFANVCRPKTLEDPIWIRIHLIAEDNIISGELLRVSKKTIHNVLKEKIMIAKAGQVNQLSLLFLKEAIQREWRRKQLRKPAQSSSCTLLPPQVKLREPRFSTIVLELTSNNLSTPLISGTTMDLEITNPNPHEIYTFVMGVEPSGGAIVPLTPKPSKISPNKTFKLPKSVFTGISQHCPPPKSPKDFRTDSLVIITGTEKALEGLYNVQPNYIPSSCKLSGDQTFTSSLPIEWRRDCFKIPTTGAPLDHH